MEKASTHTPRYSGVQDMVDDFCGWFYRNMGEAPDERDVDVFVRGIAAGVMHVSELTVNVGNAIDGMYDGIEAMAAELCKGGDAERPN